jgi:hypothetical protein
VAHQDQRRQQRKYDNDRLSAARAGTVIGSETMKNKFRLAQLM